MVPSVAISDGTPITATSQPFTAPSAAPSARPAAQLADSGQPPAAKAAIARPVIESVEPSDRSIPGPPEKITIACATASTPRMGRYCRTKVAVDPCTKPGDVTAPAA